MNMSLALQVNFREWYLRLSLLSTVSSMSVIGRNGIGRWYGEIVSSERCPNSVFEAC